MKWVQTQLQPQAADRRVQRECPLSGDSEVDRWGPIGRQGTSGTSMISRRSIVLLVETWSMDAL
jgi:hypothetical protein